MEPSALDREIRLNIVLACINNSLVPPARTKEELFGFLREAAAFIVSGTSSTWDGTIKPLGQTFRR